MMKCPANVLPLVLILTLSVSRVASRLPHHRSPFIAGGTVVPSDDQYTFVGSIERLGSHSCACALISTDYVVTAGHCVGSPPNYYEVVLGVYDRWRTGLYGQPEWYGVTAIERHAWYKKTGGRSVVADIALLYLSMKINSKNSFINVIRLPHPRDDFTGKSCVLLGWGKLASGITQPVQDKLHQANLTVISNTECQRLHENEVINRGHLCAFNDGVASGCNKDDGGPLVCRVSGDWYLSGVLSWYPKGCSSHAPSVFTSMTFFRDWISQVIAWRSKYM